MPPSNVDRLDHESLHRSRIFNSLLGNTMEISIGSPSALARATAFSLASLFVCAPSARPQVSAQDSAPRGVSSANMPASGSPTVSLPRGLVSTKSGVTSSQVAASETRGVISSNSVSSGIASSTQRALSRPQCARMREKIERDTSLLPTYSSQLRTCEESASADDPSIPHAAAMPKGSFPPGVSSSDLGPKGAMPPVIVRPPVPHL
jgi:hypothetical protein